MSAAVRCWPVTETPQALGCGACGASDATLRCSRCKAVRYCSQGCQRQVALSLLMYYCLCCESPCAELLAARFERRGRVTKEPVLCQLHRAVPTITLIGAYSWKTRRTMLGLSKHTDRRSQRTLHMQLLITIWQGCSWAGKQTTIRPFSCIKPL